MTYAQFTRQLVDKLDRVSTLLRNVTQSPALRPTVVETLTQFGRDLERTARLANQAACYLKARDIQANQHLQEVEDQLNASYEESRKLAAQSKVLDDSLASANLSYGLTLNHLKQLEEQLSDLRHQIHEEQERRRKQNAWLWLLGPLAVAIGATVDLLEDLSERYQSRQEESQRLVVALQKDEVYRSELESRVEELLRNKIELNEHIRQGQLLRDHLQAEREEDKRQIVSNNSAALQALLLRDYLAVVQHAATDEAELLQLLDRDEHRRFFGQEHLRLEVANDLLRFGQLLDTLPPDFATAEPTQPATVVRLWQRFIGGVEQTAPVLAH